MTYKYSVVTVAGRSGKPAQRPAATQPNTEDFLFWFQPVGGADLKMGHSLPTKEETKSDCPVITLIYLVVATTK